MTIKGFGSQLLKLPEIFNGNLFTIPDYQRGYAWDKRQIDELLKDIEHLLNDDTTLTHYTGTLVLSHATEKNDSNFQIVDGQQRLTTLVIFLSLLWKRLPLDEQPNFTNLYITRGTTGNERCVLQLNSDTHIFFKRIILENGNLDNCPIELEAHQRLLNTRDQINTWLEKVISSGRNIHTIKTTLESKLGFLVYAPLESAETGGMFEVINNRGKDLSELEKVKNYLIYCCVKLNAHTLRKTIDTNWSYILKALNVAKKTTLLEEGAFLRYCLVVHFSVNKTDSQHGYDEIKKRINLDRSLKDGDSKEIAIEQIGRFVEFMRTASLWYKRLYGNEHSDVSKNLITLFDQIKAQGRHASVMPLFLSLVIKLKGDEERLIKLLKLLEVLNFRVYMARSMTTRNDTGQGDLYGFAAKYYHGKLLKEIEPEHKKSGKDAVATEEDALEFYLVQFVHWHAADERFKNSFLLDIDSPDDFYKWSGLRYFLMSYEAHLQPKKTIRIDKILDSINGNKTADYPSKEHLWASKNRNAEGENNRKQDLFERRRLGNFVLLEFRLNIQGCNEDLEDKLSRYREGIDNEPPSDFEHVRRMSRDAREILEELEGRQRRVNFYYGFYKELNNRQEKRFINFAESRWSLKKFLGYKKAVADPTPICIENE